MLLTAYQRIFEEDVASNATLYTFSPRTYRIWVFKNVDIVKSKFVNEYSGTAIISDDYTLPVDTREGEVTKDYKVWFRVRDDDKAIKVLKKYVTDYLHDKIKDLRKKIIEYQNNIDRIKPITLKNIKESS